MPEYADQMKDFYTQRLEQLMRQDDPMYKYNARSGEGDYRDLNMMNDIAGISSKMISDIGPKTKSYYDQGVRASDIDKFQSMPLKGMKSREDKARRRAEILKYLTGREDKQSELDWKRSEAEKDRQMKLDLAKQKAKQSTQKGGLTEYQKYRIQKDKETSDKKTEKEQKEKELESTFEYKLKNLNSESKKRFDNISMAMQAVLRMKKALDEGQNTFSLIGDNDFTIGKTKWEEAVGRMQSGGAINDEEAARFVRMVPTATDKKDIQIAKINEAMAEMFARAKTLGFTPQEMIDYRKGDIDAAKKMLNTGIRVIREPDTDQGQQALDWLLKNPDHPRAEAVADILREGGYIE